MNLFEKLSAVQNEIGVLAKDADNPFFKSKYLTLDKIVANLLPILQKYKLSLVQYPDRDYLITEVVDPEAGENDPKQIESMCALRCADGDPQKQGSAITYARRYSLGCIFQIQTEEDDDGNKAVFASEKQIAKLNFEIKRTGADLEKIKAHYRVTELAKLKSKQASEIIQELVKRADRKE